MRHTGLYRGRREKEDKKWARESFDSRAHLRVGYSVSRPPPGVVLIFVSSQSPLLPNRNQEDKATEKRNRYQKVIICPSEPRRRIFVYGGAIFASPGSTSLVTAVQFLNA